MNWTFPQLANILKPFMPENKNGKLNQDKCVEILFSKITNDPEDFIRNVLDAKTSLRQYYTGNTGIKGIAPEITSRLNEDDFVNYLDSFTESAKSSISREVKKIDPTSNIYKTTMPKGVTKIYVEILNNAAGNKNSKNKKNPSTEKSVEGEMQFNKTILDKKFDTVFNEINHSKLQVFNDNGIHIFGLKTDTFPIRYDGLITFLLENIGRYAFSRLHWENMVKEGSLESIGLFARRRLKNELKQDALTKNKLLGEMLIYVFLEHIEGAPKLLTQVEFSNNAKKSDGVFLKVARDHCQYIVGATQIYDNIVDGINAAVKQIAKLDTDPTISPVQVIDSGYLGIIVDDDIGKLLKQILKPTENSKTLIRSYGIFIGYTLNNADKLLNMPKKEADKQFERQLCSDMELANKYLSKKISELGLQQRSFYVYMLPFGNASDAGNIIMNSALE